jgi:hypothetical protein
MNAHIEISAPLKRLIAFTACAAAAMLAPVAADRMTRTAPVQAQIIAPTGPGTVPGSREADIPSGLVSRRISSVFDVQSAHGVAMASAAPGPNVRVAGLPLRLAMR